MNQAEFGSASEVDLVLANNVSTLFGGASAGQSGRPLYIVPQACVSNAGVADFSRLGATPATLIKGTGALSATVEALSRSRCLYSARVVQPRSRIQVCPRSGRGDALIHFQRANSRAVDT